MKEEEIVNKVGGRFKLSTLIQKRLVALNAGARPLGEGPTNDKMQSVIPGIINDKISLDTSGNLRVTGASDAAGGEFGYGSGDASKKEPFWWLTPARVSRRLEHCFSDHIRS